MAIVSVNADKARLDYFTYSYNSGTYDYHPGSWHDATGEYSVVHAGFYYDGEEWDVYNMSYRIPAASSFGTVGSLSFDINYRSALDNGEFQIFLYDTQPASWYRPDEGTPVASLVKNISKNSSGSVSVSFNGLSIDASKTLYVCVMPHQKGNDSFDVQISEIITASINVTYPSFGLSVAPVSITTQETSTGTLTGRLGRTVTITYSSVSGGTTLATQTVNSDTFTITPQMSWFTTAGITAMYMSVRVTADDGLRTAVYTTFTLNKPQLTFSFQYAAVGTGQTQKITFTNRLSQTITLHFDYGNTAVRSDMTVNANTATFTPDLSWFTAVGVTSTSMSVNVTATDNLNRSYKTNFQLKRSAVVANVSPASGASVTATDEMTWTWSVTGGTTQKSAQIYINNVLAGTVDKSTTSWTSDYKPAHGTVSWYVVVTNNIDIVSQSTATSYTLTYGGRSKLVPVNSTTSGYILRKVANTFSAEIIRDPDYGTPESDYTMTSPKFYWKLSTASTWNSVNMTRSSGNKAASVTIAANTFPAGSVQWYMQATDNESNTRTTPTYTIDTNAAPITATPVMPVDTIENQNTETVFAWSDSSPIESAQKAAQLEWSADNATWTSLGSVSGTATEYHAAAGAITTSGTIWWRVRAQNSDDSWGSWSGGVSFINFGAPQISNVVANNRPRTTISWTVDNQQAYRITIDGTVYGPFFGADPRSYQIPDYLADGTHSVTVEAQNAYGQWSDPVTTQFGVVNDPGATTVTLQGIFRRDAELSWASDSSSQEFFILRDGVKVAHVRGYEWLDRTCLGYHEWEILQPRSGGYYVKSNMVRGTLSTEALAIAPLSGGDWLDLTHSTNSGRSVTYNFAQNISVRQFAGQIWPQAEASPYRTLSISFDVAWSQKEKAQADAFAALVGKPVIWKDCEGAMIGILSAYNRSNMLFYRSFSATIQRIHWEDYIDEDR